MGLWDYVSSATETISGAVMRSRAIVGGAFGKARAAAPDLSGAWKNTRDLAKVASEATVETSQAVVERMPDREGWQRIGWLVLRIADHAIEQGTKPFIGNTYRIVQEELSKNKSQEQPVKEKTENSELAELRATIQNLEKENLDVKELRLKMESLEKKLVEIKQNDINQKGTTRQKLMNSGLEAHVCSNCIEKLLKFMDFTWHSTTKPPTVTCPELPPYMKILHKGINNKLVILVQST